MQKPRVRTVIEPCAICQNVATTECVECMGLRSVATLSRDVALRLVPACKYCIGILPSDECPYCSQGRN